MESVKASSKKKIQKILNEAYVFMKQRNRMLSQRSVAKKIGVSSSYLSKIFRGERALTPALLSRLINVLKIDTIQAAQLQKLILEEIEEGQFSLETGLSVLKANVGNSKVDEYNTLGSNEFWLLEDWYTLPLLNLLTTSNVQNNTAWIAKRLGAPEQKIKYTLERLVSAGYLELNSCGGWVRTQLKLRFPTTQSHRSVRRHHSAMIKLAHQVLQRDPSVLEFQERLISGLSIASDSRKINEAKLLLEEAMYAAAEILSSGTPDEVFQINVQFFKISR